MTSAEIKTILEEHNKWLENNKNGKCADLRWANLSEADLSKADLSKANLRGANLICADLRWADLGEADLRGVDLREADLRGVNLWRANLRGANLEGADLYYPIACPEKDSFIGWKKARGYIVELEVLSEAKRSSSTGRKCRCDKARVVAIENIDGSESHITEVNSNYDKTFIYRFGEIVSVEDFDNNRWNECALGIHFFITREEAVRYS